MNTNSSRKQHTMIAWMEDKPGVLNRVAGLFRRRNFNIESLTVGHSETSGISRMTFVAEGTDRDMRQIKTQLSKLINVTEVTDVTHSDPISRELALIKVKANSKTRTEVMQIVEIFRAHIIHVDMESVIVQIVGKVAQIDSLLKLLNNFGILEMVRTGRIAMVRDADHSQLRKTAVATHQNGHQ